jgi:ligand-binding SRPBCC domain-containing protein
MTHHFETEHVLPISIDRVFRFFANPANLPRIMPPSTGAELLCVKLLPPPGVSAVSATVTTQEPLAGIGSEIIVSVRILPFLPFRMQWIAKITEFEWNHHFADEQISGPFKIFQHRHELRSDTRGTIVRDAIEYNVGFGWLGTLINAIVVAPMLRRTFRYRQQAVERLLRSS